VGEVSGIVPIKGRERCYWVHNDSGASARIIALHESGKLIAEVSVTGAEAHDWEDISRGPAYQGAPPSLPERLYIGDTGNNDRKRETFVIYRLPEPELPSLEPEQKLASAPARKIQFRYPDTPFDCEAVAVHPMTGEIYLFTKILFGSSVYRLENPETPGEAQTAVKVAQIEPRFLVTAADISPDGRRLILRTYLDAEEYRLPENAPFERIFAQPKVVVPTSFTEIQGEAICFDHDGRGYVTVGEGIPGIIHRVRRKKDAPVSPAPK
jgi:hypothetical protein